MGPWLQGMKVGLMRGVEWSGDGGQGTPATMVHIEMVLGVSRGWDVGVRVGPISA